MRTAELTAPLPAARTTATRSAAGPATRGTTALRQGPAVSDERLHVVLDKGIAAFFRDAVRVALQKPTWFMTAVRLYARQREAARRRSSWRARGAHVPAFMIMSVTRSCNLRCKGCYARSLHTSLSPSLNSQRMTELLAEARELGISSVLLTGGEPLTNSKLLDITRDFPQITFPLFTNGTMIDERTIAALRAQRNVVPVLSLEGGREQTDRRRGGGVYERVATAMSALCKQGLFFGCSITVTSENAAAVYDREWVSSLYRRGCRLFFYVEYVPVGSDSEALVPSGTQRESGLAAIRNLRKQIPALFVAFPGDEELFGGCLAAGRGFVHISAGGDVEPCPFAPYADRNVVRTSLKNALDSPMLEKIRANHANLQETSGGCALWAEREWVASLAGRTEAPAATVVEQPTELEGVSP